MEQGQGARTEGARMLRKFPWVKDPGSSSRELLGDVPGGVDPVNCLAPWVANPFGGSHSVPKA